MRLWRHFASLNRVMNEPRCIVERPSEGIAHILYVGREAGLYHLPVQTQKLRSCRAYAEFPEPDCHWQKFEKDFPVEISTNETPVANQGIKDIDASILP